MKSFIETDLRSAVGWDGSELLPGDCRLDVAFDGDISYIQSSRWNAPTRLFLPRCKPIVPHVYVSSCGEGFVAGDQTRMLIRLRSDSRCVVSSLGSNKIYRNPKGLPCGQAIEASIDSGAILVHAPEPTSCYANSRFDQVQRFHLAEDGNLVLLDWMTGGRYRCGERFAFQHYRSRQSIFVKGRHLIEDAIDLTPAITASVAPFIMGDYHCVGLMIVLGSKFAGVASDRLASERDTTLARGGDPLTVVHPLPHDVPGFLLRAIGREIEDVRRIFESVLKQIDPILGVETWRGKN